MVTNTLSNSRNINTETIKGVVFDKDGTLFDFNAVWSVWCDRVIDQLSGDDELLADKLAHKIGYNRANRTFTSGSLIVSGASDDIAVALAELLTQHNAESVIAVCDQQTTGLPLAPVNNLVGTLQQLSSSGLKLGVATNDSEASAHTQLKESHIAEYFDFVSGFDSGFGSKPGAGMLQAFCSATGLSASEIAMVGDSVHDIGAGIAAGVGLTVGVLTGPATESDLLGHADATADVVMPDIGGLLELLL